MISALMTAGVGLFQSLGALGLVFASSSYMACVLPVMIIVLYTL